MRKLVTIIAALIPLMVAATEIENNNSNNNLKSKIEMKKLNKFEFPQLPYAYDALEPFIDKLTMEIHYSKHHNAYFNNFVAAIEGSELEKQEIEEIFANISKHSAAVRNNGGGYYNHILFWENMKVNSAAPSAKLAAAIEKKFGSMEELKKQFLDAGKSRFGSGWAWLSVDEKGELFVSSTPNQDNPLMDLVDKKGTPVLAMDVWEHAYYLKYQNRRPDYVEAFWNVVNWEVVSERYEAIVK